VFTAPLDDGPMKSTSGGWAREITTRQLPLAANLAIAHLFIAAGGIREMHWHTSSEWAYVLDGHCQIAVTGADGAIEVANLAAGDLWYFPAGRPHSVQTLGHEPCHAILVFDDGNYGEHGTFGLTDLVSRMAPPFLSAAFGPPESAFSRFPAAETYVMQGPVLAVDGPEASAAQPFAPQKSHRFAILAFPAARRGSGGTLRVASAREFPSSSRMSGMHLQLDSRGAQAPHWHPNADEMLYVAAGRVRAVMFGPDKRLAVAELGAGDCVYFPRGCAHFLENVGDDRAELVGATNAGEYEEVLLGDWFVRAPRHTLAANLGIPEPELPRFNSRPEALILR
jgi:oxalate decarboxylase